MRERTYPSRKEIAQRIAEANRIKSQTLTSSDVCVPVTVAFTHDFSKKEWAYGLKTKAYLNEIQEGARAVAKDHGEEMQELSLLLLDDHRSRESLSNMIAQCRALWIWYQIDEFNAHLYGLIPIGDDQIMQWDSADKTPLSRTTISQVFDNIVARHLYTQNPVHVFGFIKNASGI